MFRYKNDAFDGLGRHVGMSGCRNVGADSAVTFLLNTT